MSMIKEKKSSKEIVTTFEKRIFFAIGLVCTWNAFIIKGYSLYNYLILLWLAVYIIERGRERKIYVTNTSSRFVLFFTTSIVLSLVSAMFILPHEWEMNSFKNLIKFVLVFATIFLLYNGNLLCQIREYFLGGLFLGALVQMVWGYLQFIAFVLFDVKLNTKVFSELLGINSVSGTPIIWDSYVAAAGKVVLRMKGLGWEAANFALIMIIGYILCNIKNKSVIYKALFIGAVLLSTSRSGWVSLAAVVIVQVFRKLYRRKKKFKLNKKLAIEILMGGVLGTIILVKMWDPIYTYVFGMLGNLKNSLNIVDESSSSALHISYYTNLFAILKNMKIVNVLFGCGLYSAGYIVSKNMTLFADGINNIGWNPESDFVTLILGNGILGLIIYYYYAFKGVIYHRKDDYSLIIIAILAEGITYLTIRGTWSLLLITMILADVRNGLIRTKR